MSKAIQRRLAAVELRLNPPVPTIREIIIRGGLTSGIAPIARVGADEWEAAPGEAFEAFRARAMVAATAAGAQFVVFGGLRTRPP